MRGTIVPLFFIIALKFKNKSAAARFQLRFHLGRGSLAGNHLIISHVCVHTYIISNNLISNFLLLKIRHGHNHLSNT